MTMGPGTVNQLSKDISEVDFLLYRSKRSCGIAFVAVHQREQMEFNASSGRDLVLAAREMQRRMVSFRRSTYIFDCGL